MASIAFGAAVSNAGPLASLGIGYQIAGGLLAAYIDSTFVMPNLFPDEDPQAPDIAGIAISGFNEGGPMNFVIGPNARVEGQVIWASDPELRSKVTSISSGKSGQGQKSIEHLYYVDLAVAFTDAPDFVDSIPQIYANGKLFFQDDPTISKTSSSISATAFVNGHEHVQILVTPTGGGGKQYAAIPFPRNHLKITSTDIAVDLSVFHTGSFLSVAGFTSGLNNGLFEVTEVSKNPGVDSSVTVFLGLSPTVTGGYVEDPIPYPYTNRTVVHVPGVNEAAGNLIALDQTNPNFDSEVVGEIRIYDGSQVLPDDLIVSIEDPVNGDVPAFHGKSYVVFEDLLLNHFGNSVPTFSADVVQDPSMDLGDAFATLLERAGIGADKYEIDPGLVGETFLGFNARGPISTTKILQPLMLAYDVLAQTTPGAKLRFFKREDVIEHTLDPSEFAVVEESASRVSNPFTIERQDKTAAPSEVQVTYLDPELNYQQGMQKERRITFENENIQVVNLPMALDAATAKQITRRLLATQITGQDRFRLQLGFKRMDISENDRISFILDGKRWRALVDRAERGRNHRVVLECTEEIPENLIWAGEVEPRPSTITGDVRPQPAPRITLDVLDLPALRQGDVGRMGLYLTAVAPGIAYPGALVQERNVDTAGSFEDLLTIDDGATAGYIQTVPSDLAGQYFGGWDYESAIDVVLDFGTLTGVTVDQVFQGHNIALIGREIFHFQNATLQGDGSYRLTSLLRGSYGTEEHISGHVVGERFVLLTSGSKLAPSTNFAGFDADDFDALHGLVAASSRANLGTAVAQYATITGATLRPYPVGWYRAYRDLGKNLGIVFLPRTRNFSSIFSTKPSDLRVFEFDILDPTAVTDDVVHTYRLDDTGGQTSPFATALQVNWTYTATQQQADGATPGQELRINIYQINAQVGRGFPLSVTV